MAAVEHARPTGNQTPSQTERRSHGRVKRILQVTPTIYARGSVIGGGEKGVVYVDHALRRAASADGLEAATAVLSFGADPSDNPSGHTIDYHIIPGSPWSASSIDAGALIAELRTADAVYIDQCLHPVGLFAAAHARLLGCRVIGKDSGAGEHPMLGRNPELAQVYHGFHAQSRFALSVFSGFDVPARVIPGPMDTETYVPPSNPRRDPRMVAAVGRIVAYKGLDRIIRALPAELSLIIAGQPYDSDYARYLHELARGKNVTFNADLDDAGVRTLLHTAGLFVHASTHFDYRGQFAHKPELLGLAPLEAISCGLPTLVSNAGALPELADLPGCLCFENDVALAGLLRSQAAGTLNFPDGQAMHAAVAERYGSLTFGRELLAFLLGND